MDPFHHLHGHFRRNVLHELYAIGTTDATAKLDGVHSHCRDESVEEPTNSGRMFDYRTGNWTSEGTRSITLAAFVRAILPVRGGPGI